MKRLLISVLTVGVVATAGVLATNAFFSDTETSTGNLFAAGALDLQIDNESYVTDENGDLVLSPDTSWALDDPMGLFFNFSDVKPGDLGEDTISLHVNDNDAWICAAAQVTDDSDQTCTDPELEDDLNCDEPGLGLGELDDEVNFAFWADDGDNVLETDEVDSIFISGPVSGLGGLGQIALADSDNNIWDGLEDSPVVGGDDYFIGKAWCFGTLTPNAIDPGVDLSPLVDGTGFDCNGEPVNNAAQTDQVIGDIQFYATQSRNNDDFLCDSDYSPVWPTPTPNGE